MIVAALAFVSALAAAGPGALGNTAVEGAVARFYSPAFKACDAKAVATTDMVDCRRAETARWDARLNAAYQADMKSFTPPERAALQKAQRAWLAYRDANCAAYVDPVQWGTISRINAAGCGLKMTVERTLELEDFPPSPCGEETC